MREALLNDSDSDDDDDDALVRNARPDLFKELREAGTVDYASATPTASFPADIIQHVSVAWCRLIGELIGLQFVNINSREGLTKDELAARDASDIAAARGGGRLYQAQASQTELASLSFAV